MIRRFNDPWVKVPFVWIDTETTGIGRDREVVDVAFVRFEGGKMVDEESSLIDPRIPIPEETSAIHGITGDMVKGMPTITQFMDTDGVRAILDGAQPAAYNAPFDRRNIPLDLVPEDWPWIDCLTLVRGLDPYVKGKGRHKLSVACDRHGISIDSAHRAAPDAIAAAKLFYALVGKAITPDKTLGQMLARFETERIKGWFGFNQWLAQQQEKERGNEGSAGDGKGNG